MEGLIALGSNMKSLRVLNCAFLGRLCDAELITIANWLPGLEELDISSPINTWSLGRQVQVTITGDEHVTDSGIEVLASKLRGLRKINVSGNIFLSDRSLVVLSSSCFHLRQIVLLHCSLITQKGIQFLMSNSPNLSSILVERIQNQGPFSDTPLVDSLSFPRGLSTIEIYDSSVSDEFLCSLAKSGIPLKMFALGYCSSFTFSGVSFLLQTYRSLEFLAFIQVDFLTDEHISKLTRCLSHLITVNLKYCSQLTKSTLSTLAKNCPSLEDIDMRYTGLGKREQAVDVIRNSRVRTLNLARNKNLSDECLAVIASIFPCLEMLDLSFCSGITEKGIGQFLNSGSKVRHLQINGCCGINSIGCGPKLPKLKILQAAGSGINDGGLASIGNRCCALVNLDLEHCLSVTPSGLKEMLTNCNRLREINLSQCVPLSVEFIAWLVFSKPSLKKIIPPCSSFLTEGQRKLFLRHGCLVCNSRRS